jgi:hypothetical protein
MFSPTTHDRVVDQDAEHHDEREGRDSVDRDLEGGDRPERAEQGDRYAERHPEGEARPQEHGDEGDHEQEPCAAVPEQRVEPVAQDLGRVPPDRERYPLGQAGLRLGDVGLHLVGEVDHVLLADAEYAHHHRGVTVEAGALVRVLEAVPHHRDVGERDAGPVRAGEHDDLVELAPPVGLSLGAEQDLAPLRLDRPTRQVERGAAHGLCHLVEAETVAAEHLLRDLDRDLVGARTGELDLGDARKRRDLVAHALAELLETPLVHGARDRDVRDRAADGHLRDDRLLGLLGERVEGVDPVLDVVERLADVGSREKLDDHVAAALRGRRADLVDALDPLELLLDADADALLDLFGGGAAVLDRDRDHVDLDVGHRLLGDPRHRDDATDHEHRHHQVRGDVVLCEPRDGALHERTSSTPRVSIPLSFSSTTRTRIPSTTVSRGETQTRSPDERPERTTTSLRVERSGSMVLKRRRLSASTIHT